jgi:3-oxoacyl-[acyl-carrier protein] reductase
MTFGPISMQQPILENRTAIVTGAAGSLGKAIALGLRDRGCRVIALDSDADALAAMGSEAGIVTESCDLLDGAAAEQSISAIWERHGPISILINAVGLIHSAPLVNVAARTDRRHSLEAWRRVIDINLTAVFVATANVVDRMVANRIHGVVINFSSIAAAGNAGQGAYSAAKSGVNAMTSAWAKELGALGIRFVAIAPGFIDTPSTHVALAEPIIREWTRRTPLKRLGTVEDVMAAVIFAVSNEHMTGKVIEIDGGLTV